MSGIQIHPEVRDALTDGQPVVGLETAVVTHGLPRTPWSGPPPTSGWRIEGPTNLEAARAMAQTVRGAGAVPAMVAVIKGVLTIGLDDDTLARFADDGHAHKASASTLAGAICGTANAGTTVSATLVALKATSPPIRVFATGGIGGVHRGWTDHPDISADLRALAASPVCVVCAGAKTILDIPATVEALETLGVAVVGFGTDHFPRFVCPPDEALPVAWRVDAARDAAAICLTHWNTLGQASGILLVRPVDPAHAVPVDDVDAALTRGPDLPGAARTPALLSDLAERTDGRTLRANLTLLLDNARLAAEVATALLDRS